MNKYNDTGRPQQNLRSLSFHLISNVVTSQEAVKAFLQAADAVSSNGFSALSTTSTTGPALRQRTRNIEMDMS